MSLNDVIFAAGFTLAFEDEETEGVTNEMPAMRPEQLDVYIDGIRDGLARFAAAPQTYIDDSMHPHVMAVYVLDAHPHRAFVTLVDAIERERDNAEHMHDEDEDEADDDGVIRAKGIMDGALTLAEIAERGRAFAEEAERLGLQGWTLKTRVEDDYAFLARPAKSPEERLTAAVWAVMDEPGDVDAEALIGIVTAAMGSWEPA